MSKLTELLEIHCPNGVKYKTIKETVGLNRGRRLTKNELSDDGLYEVYHGSKDTPLGLYDKYNAPKNTTIVVNTGGIGGVKFIENEFWCSDGSFWLGQSEDIHPKYLYYCLSGYEKYFASKKRVGGVPTIDRSVVEEFSFPVPPLAVQEEIVKILDRFAEYAAELQAELQARQEQYGYYRNKLLTFNEIGGGSVIWMKMSEVYDMKAGKTIISSMIENVKTLKNPYPCYGGNGLRGYVSEYNQQGNKVLIGRQGALCGNVCFANNSFYATEHAVVVSEKGYCLPRYTYHLLTKMKLNQYKTAGAQPGLSVSRLEKLLIPIPSMEMQLKIVSILDRFDELISDLAQGLPAEITAVQEQYEYYRNKLLSFPKYKLSA